MAAFATQYVIADAGVFDERKSLQAVQRHYDVNAAPPGKFAEFLTDMVRLAVPEWGFEEHLELFNQEQLHAAEVQFLAENGAPTPLAFKEKFGAAFVQHFVDNVPCDDEDEDPAAVAAFMLEFSERAAGQDWIDLNGYERFGAEILDLMHSTVEEFKEEEAEAEEAEEEAEAEQQSAAKQIKRRRAN